MKLARALRTAGRCGALAAGRYADAVSGCDEELAGRIRGEQIRSVLRHLTFATLATVLNGAVLVASVWNEVNRASLLAWLLAVLCMVCLSVARRLTGSVSRHTRASHSALVRTVRNALMFGVLWGLAPILFFVDASGGSRVVMACICAGTIGGSAFIYSRIPAAAIAMIVPIALGSIWALAQSGGPEFQYVLVLVVGYCGVLIRGVLLNGLEGARQFFTRSEIEQIARRDGLTNLDNRATFRGMVADAILRHERANEPCAILYLDLDGLQKINDVQGHAVGDEILVEAAARLQTAVRRVDRIARLDSNQFAIIAPDISGEATLRAFASRVISAFQAPFTHAQQSLDISVSIGAFVIQSGVTNVETVMRNAELALQKAQRSGRGSYHVFGPSDDAALFQRIGLERDLRLALERREFYLNFQPLLEIESQRVTGFEALLRWRHPVRGNIPPSVFIPIAEDTGVIDAIGAWVIREACAAAAAWPPGMRVGVNLSAHQLKSRTLNAFIATTLEETGLEPQQLEIEITESVLVTDDQEPLDILTALRATGVGLALDDFGTGYSSLSYLRRLPFSRIKIDRSFVTDISTSRDCAAIVKSIVTLARDLEMDVIAEGIETHEQYEALRRLNCSEVQGFLIGRPMNEEAIESYLRKGVTLQAA